jgi:PAS domain S-box-containing protein
VQADLQISDPAKGVAAAPAPLETFTPRSWLEGGMAILDRAASIVEVNEPLANWLEKSRVELAGRPFWDFLAALAPQWRPALAQLRQSPGPFDRRELKFAAAEGKPAQWFILEIARTPDASFVRLNSILPPLSELEEAVWDEHLRTDSSRREMYMRLLRAEARLASLTQRWPCVIFSQRPDFSLQFASSNIEELTGITVADWSSQPRRFWELVHEADAPELQQQFKRSIQTGAAVTNTYRVRHARTGHVAYILEHRQPALSQNGLLLGYEVVWLDVTRQTIAEKRLSTAAWKETLAVLTLGLAHDFKNIMAGIHSLSETFLDQVEPGHAFEEGLSLIKKSSLQATQLVQRMINLHVGQTGERNYHDLNEIARDLVELVSKILPRRITIVTELAGSTLPVYADVVEFRQVVINLMLNAADAMPQSGRLTLRTSRHTEFPPLEHVKGLLPRLPCVCLTVEDTGCGIKPRHLASIFDPFFTTKSKGSGLGLYNARIAAEKHRGAISVNSREGAGATFQIWLAEADFSEADRAAAVSAAAVAVPRRRTILLLGQTGELLDKTAELLRGNNYHVVVATSVEAGLVTLGSDDYEFAGVMLLVERSDPALHPLLAEARQRHLTIALQLAGCNQDSLDSRLVEGVDLLVSLEQPEAERLVKLKALFHPAT